LTPVNVYVITVAMTITSVNVPTGLRERAMWIKVRLWEAGVSFASIAKAEGLDRKTPQVVLTKPYPRIERVVAEHLGMTPAEIWPERYTGHRSALAPPPAARKAKRRGSR
jgi:Ner family transcriptional regulator